MPRIARQTLLARFRAKLATGRPLIGGGAGTGLSAKCEEAGGIDLIVIYNSGRYRMAGRGSLAGLLAYGNANEIVGGVLSAGPTRLDVFAKRALPYVGSCGALDMVNFGPWDTVPERFKNRRLYRHNPTVTLMRTTVDECRAIGAFLADKLNAMTGPVRFLLPEAGVSSIDRPGQPFHDPEADRALFETIAQRFRAGADRKLLRLPLHVNDEAFADALVAAWREVAASAEQRPPLSARAYAPHR